MKKYLYCLASLLLAASCTNQISEQSFDTYSIVSQSRGPQLGYSPTSGVEILRIDGYAFKDLNKNGRLDVYEDWRQKVESRVADLASQMTVEQICGLMLYSRAVTIDSAALNSDVLSYMKDDFIRHMLVSAVKDARTAAMWSNNVQSYCE